MTLLDPRKSVVAKEGSEICFSSNYHLLALLENA